MSFLISDALADTAKLATTSSTQSLMSLLPMIILLVVFMYLMVIRPQSKKAKEHRNLINNLQPGDEILTIGGILAKIKSIAGDFVILSIADNTVILVQKGAIASVVPRGTMKSINE